MLRLRTLGALSLERDGKLCSGAAGQRAPLAILAFIATSETGTTRDRIAALFWPESDAERAHGSLKQALYSLRRDAAAQDLFIGSTALKLNPNVIRCDATDFQISISSKDLKQAVELYTGDFLDGVHLTGNGEFERWVDEQRATLASDYASALESLAASADANKAFSESAGWWRRLAIADPLSTRVARHYIAALAASGDKNSALEYAELHQRMLAVELQAGPDITIAQLIEDIKAGRVEEPPSPRVVSSLSFSSSAPEPSHATPKRRQLKHIEMLGIAATTVVALLGIVWQRPANPITDENLKSIALLPCRDERADSGNGIGDRWTEELINKLVSVGGLRPKSFLSTDRYRNSSKSAHDIGVELNAGSLLRCRIAEDSSRVDLKLQLIRSDDDEVIWSQEYEKPAGSEGINSAQSSAALDIARFFRTKVSPAVATATQRPITKDSAALRLYRLGRHFYNRGGPGDMRRSVAAFKDAIAHDSSFALAYANLADATSMVGEGEVRPAIEWQPEAERYARKALELDESIAEAHSQLAFYYSDFVYDSLSAAQQHRRALELNPSSVDAHLWYGLDLFTWERPAEALAEYQKALDLDPMLPLARMHIARVFVFTGQYARAKPYLEQAQQIFPEWKAISHLHATGLIAEGLNDSAIAVLNRAEKTGANGILAEGSHWSGYLYGIAGRRDKTREILDRLLDESAKRPVDPIGVAVLEMGLGNKEAAITWLQRAYSERSSELRYVLGPQPAFKSIRTDPRFQELRRKVGFHRP